MPMMQQLTMLALKPLLDGACKAAGFKAAEQPLDAIAHFLGERIFDRSQKLPTVLHQSTEKAWRTLEVALAGESLWTRLVDKAEDRAFREQIRVFLDTPGAGLEGANKEFRDRCLAELREMRKKLPSAPPSVADLAKEAAPLARFGNTTGLVESEMTALAEMADELRYNGCPNLAQLIALKPGATQPPLLVLAARYFFRRAVEQDEVLARGLTHDSLQRLDEAQERGFAALDQSLDTFSRQMEEALTAVYDLLSRTHENVLDIKAELSHQTGLVRELADKVSQLLAGHKLEKRSLSVTDSISVQNEDEQRLIRDVVKRYRELPADQRGRLPALLNGIGKLEVVAGNFVDAQQDFATLSTLVDDSAARAEVQHNLYLSALEQKNFDAALEALKQAARLAPDRYEPFPLNKFEPQRILGAGGFGVAVLCRNRRDQRDVVIKTLRTEGLDRPVSDVFNESSILSRLSHPAVIASYDSDFADKAETRPYFVMEYFEGGDLEVHIRDRGRIAATEFLPLATLIAEGLRAAHGQGILHRDIKPANLLVRRENDRWHAKLIDFGLALRASAGRVASFATRSLRAEDTGVAGTLDYAAPEQMGRLPGVAVSKKSDIYGFGKLCYYALLATPEPDETEREELPEGWRKLLGECTARLPDRRPADFGVVLERLQQLAPNQPKVSVVQPKPTTWTPLPSLQEMADTIKPAVPLKPMTPMQPMQPMQPMKPLEPLEFWKSSPVELSLDIQPITQPSGEIRQFIGHTGSVSCVALSPDGSLAATGGQDGAIFLWDVASGQEAFRLIAHLEEVSTLLFTADGKRLYSAGADQTVRFWDTKTGKQQRCFDRQSNRALALSPDGSLALSGGPYDGKLRLFHPTTGKEVKRVAGHTNFIQSLAFVADGTQAVSMSLDRTVRLWGMPTGNAVRSCEVEGRMTSDVCVLPKDAAAPVPGVRVIVGTADGSIRSIDLQRAREVKRFEGHVGEVSAVAVLPNNRAVSGGQDGTVRVWDLGAGKEVRCLTGHAGRVLGLVVTADGKHALSGGEDGTVRLWIVEG